MQHDPALAVADVLAPGQRDRILDRFTTTNPHRQGIPVADVLDLLADHDSDLDVANPFWDATCEVVPELADHLAASFAVRALIWGRPEDQDRRDALTAAALAGLLAKVDEAAARAGQ